MNDLFGGESKTEGQFGFARLAAAKLRTRRAQFWAGGAMWLGGGAA